MFDLTGKRALVTGSTQGIGYAIAKALTRYGAQVYIHCSSDDEKAKRIAAELGTDLWVTGDLGIQGCAEKLYEKTGGLDIVAANASVQFRTPWDEIPPEEFDRQINVNLRSTGGNLTTAIKTRTKTGGAVIWGGIRDVEQMKQVPDVQVYYRGIDPTPIRDFVMKDFNGITRIGKATVLPGDIVYGAGGGVLFIPAHLVQEVVEGAAKTHVKDDFGFLMIGQNKFTTAQIDRATWTEEMLDMLVEWINTDPRGEQYRYLDWTHEYDLARNGDPDDTQTML